MSPAHRITSIGELRNGAFETNEELDAFLTFMTESRHRRRPYEWSGGMLQRASIVAANAHRPGVIVADEPTSALDADRADAILSALSTTGAAILLISHDLTLVRAHSHHIAVLYAGRIVEEGASERVPGHPRHPYTAALLAASPRPGAGLPAPLSGPPSRIAGEAAGCSFAPRCPLADNICRGHKPELRDGVACWHAVTARRQGREDDA